MQEEQFKAHGIWQLLSYAQDQLDSYPEDQRRAPLFVETRERLEYVRWILEQSDPALITQQELDSVQGPIQNAVNHIGQSQGRSQRLVQLDQWFAPFFEKFPYPRVRKIFRSERTEILNEFEREIRDMQFRLQEFIKDANDRQEKFLHNIEAAQEAIEIIEKEIAGIEVRVGGEFEKWEAQSAQQISERLASLSNEFASGQAERNSEHQEVLNNISKRLRDFDSLYEEVKVKLSQAMEGMKRDLGKQQNQMESDGKSYLEKIRNIYQIVGQTTLAGDFERAAAAETKSGSWFAFLAAVFFIVAPLFFVYQWSTLNVTGADPVGLLLKLSAGLAFLIPAAYFGNTSRRHHRVATALRSLGIRVATFDAYLANFPDAERNRIKEEMAELFFAAQITPDQLRSSNPKEVERLLGLTDTVLGQAQATIRSMSGSGGPS